MIRWVYFPQSDKPTDLVLDVVSVFERNAEEIDSATHDKQNSDQALSKLAPDLQALEFRVETGKKKAQKVHVPVLFGYNGAVTKSFEADAYHEEAGFVLEVEAGRGVTNYQFLKDLFQGCMMHGVDTLGIAVRNTYRGHKDFDKAFRFFDTLYTSNRLKLPLQGILLIGY